MTRLPYDCTRCTGTNCPVREQCLLHEQLSNTGPRTPVADYSADRIIVVEADCEYFVGVGE